MCATAPRMNPAFESSVRVERNTAQTSSRSQARRWRSSRAQYNPPQVQSTVRRRDVESRGLSSGITTKTRTLGQSVEERYVHSAYSLLYNPITCSPPDHGLRT